ncbi:MAG: hypothetical protein BGO37_00890 [Cellulomonas sp. 73-92]|uniref:S1C family serine protease n=1 Tax=Cellulomonas sp. 73-92 TaxID=1895740 RepID=UPI00092C342E|nr:trypsin-like peptidase domain-containing protein [Cellulomonas sp. 73-92]OJV78943.1 MAG: hypothetical protein BGO37_00890 [Cellulomonas sp. 73-92]
MSEQQPQHEPWTQPPADGAQGAQPYTGPARQVPPQQHPGQQPSPAQPNPGQQPYPTQQVPGQQPYPGQQAYPGQQGYPGQQPYAQPYAWQQHPYAAQPYREPPRMYGAMPYYPLPDQPIGAIAIDPRRRHVRRLAISVGAAAVLAVTLAVGVAFGVGPTRETSAFSGNNGSSSSAGQVPGGSTGSGGSSSTNPGGSAGSGGSSSANPNAVPNFGGDGDGDRFGNGAGSSGSGAAAGAVAATAAQQKGVVTIDSQLAYQGASSAGTGMILSADGLVLTNNHVIDGATAIQVTDESTGQQYTATVVGTDPTADVALLQLKGASGLTPITLDKNGVTTGTSITAIGNAEGTGNLVAAAGSVTNTNQTMTAQTELGGSAETLSGLIEFQAAVVSGDSGGPVLDSQGEVVGMTTAASNGMGLTDAYAITIDSALTVVHEIQAGDTANGTITLGYPAFLGVSLSTPRSQAAGGSGTGSGTTSGATIAGVVTGTPAASAGLAAGDTITAVDGKAVTSADGLSSALGAHKPGDRVTITWVSGTTGTTHSATVTLVAGPAN